MRVMDEKWTNYGPSCMNHAHADEFPADTDERIAFAMQTQLCVLTALGQAMRSEAAAATAARHRRAEHQQLVALQAVAGAGIDESDTRPYLLPLPVPCAYCGERARTRKIIYAYDGELRWYEVALCDRELRALRTCLPTQRVGLAWGAGAIEPVPMAMIARELARSETRAPARRARAAAAAAAVAAAEAAAASAAAVVPASADQAEADADDDEDDDSLFADVAEATPEEIQLLELRTRLRRVASSAKLGLLLQRRPDLRQHWATLGDDYAGIGFFGAPVGTIPARITIYEMIIAALTDM